MGSVPYVGAHGDQARVAAVRGFPRRGFGTRPAPSRLYLEPPPEDPTNTWARRGAVGTRQGGLMKRSIFGGALALSVMLLAAGCSSNSSPSNSTNSSFKGTAMTGAGATFPEAEYTQRIKCFLSVAGGAKVNYQALGAGVGIQ